jgi:hypothetical protein
MTTMTAAVRGPEFFLGVGPKDCTLIASGRPLSFSFEASAGERLELFAAGGLCETVESIQIFEGYGNCFDLIQGSSASAFMILAGPGQTRRDDGTFKTVHMSVNATTQPLDYL